MNEDDVLRFDKAVFERAHARMTSSPIDLTEHDFAQLEIVSKTLETHAREALRQAQLAVVAVPLTKTKRVKAETMDAFLQQYGSKPATYQALNNLADRLLAPRGGIWQRRDVMNACRVVLIDSPDMPALRTAVVVHRGVLAWRFD
jgi:hypothetical protein